MPSAELPLNAGPHWAVFLAIVKRLQGWPDLRRTVKVWRVWSGLPTDADPWASGHCPGVRLTPSVGESGPLDPATLESELQIGVEIATSGTHLSQPIALWRAMKLCLAPDSFRSALEAAGAYPQIIDCGPLRPGVDKDSPGIVISRASISVACIETIVL